jgi:hypothetical protein
MDEKEPEVIHLEWERVQDPTREPPPEMVVAEPEPPKRRILPDLDGPNPFRSFPRLTTLQEIGTFALFLIAAFAWVALRGQP